MPILFLGIFLSLLSFAPAAEPFVVGQRWSYETRKGEGDSRLVILRIDDDERGGHVVHVGIVGAKLKLSGREPAGPWQMDHMPFA